MSAVVEPTAAVSRPSGSRVAALLNLLILIARTLTAHKLQMSLTLLTMAVGAMALASCFFVGKGALASLLQNLHELVGPRAIITPEPGPSASFRRGRAYLEFTPSELAAVRRAAAGARYVVPLYYGNASVSVSTRTELLQVDGICAEMAGETGYVPVVGKGLEERAYQGGAPQCLLTESAARRLGIRAQEPFPAVFIGATRCDLRGLVRDPPFADDSFQERVIVPYADAIARWGRAERLPSICVGWSQVEQVDGILKGVAAALDATRGPGTYSFMSAQPRFEYVKRIIGNYMLLGLVQAAFCIAVASVGITTVMLANVQRRTQEFAIRIVMGARLRELSVAVAVEGFCTGLLGGILGVGAAVCLSSAICSSVGHYLADGAEIIPAMTLQGLVLPVIVCGLCGLAAGVVPALHVRSLDILSALRSE